MGGVGLFHPITWTLSTRVIQRWETKKNSRIHMRWMIFHRQTTPADTTCRDEIYLIGDACSWMWHRILLAGLHSLLLDLLKIHSRFTTSFNHLLPKTTTYNNSSPQFVAFSLSNCRTKKLFGFPVISDTFKPIRGLSHVECYTQDFHVTY